MKFSISKKNREEMVHFFLSRPGELSFHFLICSRLSRFLRKKFILLSKFKILKKFLFLFLNKWDFANRFSFKILREKIHFLLSILPSISLPILVRNHILQFGLILTSSVLQRGKYFKKLFFEEVGDEDAKEFDMVGEWELRGRSRDWIFVVFDIWLNIMYKHCTAR